MCRFDPGARVWDGKESFEVFLPYSVSSDEGEFAPEPYSLPLCGAISSARERPRLLLMTGNQLAADTHDATVW